MSVLHRGSVFNLLDSRMNHSVRIITVHLRSDYFVDINMSSVHFITSHNTSSPSDGMLIVGYSGKKLTNCEYQNVETTAVRSEM